MFVEAINYAKLSSMSSWLNYDEGNDWTIGRHGK